eukprot:TRINITY_DN8296_c0_g1_i2.p1 TRINITY_DN8296_c0_g1~~TRINITY_DN8296_c0_g1_i2.p1  ORF type:complete len:535 (-),score=102.25 TRINITY_DN8296_c0_g1_i2:87-1451(-)
MQASGGGVEADCDGSTGSIGGVSGTAAAAASGSARRRALQHVVALWSHGSRVALDPDRRLLEALLTEDTASDSWTTSGKLDLQAATLGATGLQKMVERLPAGGTRHHAEWCGLHESAEVYRRDAEANSMFDDLLACWQPARAVAGDDEEDVVAGFSNWSAAEISAQKCVDMLVELEPLPQVEESPAEATTGALELAVATAAAAEHPADAFHAGVTVAFQRDAERYNGLLRLLRSSLNDAVEACQGRLNLTAAAEALLGDLAEQRVPSSWLAVSYPSRKSLAGYLLDLKERVGFVRRSCEGTTLAASLWLPGFFSIPSFLAEVTRSLAKHQKISVDAVELDAVPVPEADQSVTHLQSSPVASDAANTHGARASDAGPPGSDRSGHVIVHGLFLEGCRWEASRSELTEATAASSGLERRRRRHRQQECTFTGVPSTYCQRDATRIPQPPRNSACYT